MGFGLYWQPAIVFFTLANKVHSFIHSLSLYDFFCSVSGTSQIGCKIKFNCLVLAKLI